MKERPYKIPASMYFSVSLVPSAMKRMIMMKDIIDRRIQVISIFFGGWDEMVLIDSGFFRMEKKTPGIPADLSII